MRLVAYIEVTQDEFATLNSPYRAGAKYLELVTQAYEFIGLAIASGADYDGGSLKIYDVEVRIAEC